MTGLNQLIKFSSAYFDAYKGQTIYQAIGGKVDAHTLFAVKPDGSDWASQDEMFETHSSGLRYYDSLDQVPTGSKVVGILFEYRNTHVTNNNFSNYARLKVAKPGTAVVALDTEVWFAGNDNVTSFWGSNGQAVANVPKPSTSIYASDGGRYRPSQFGPNGQIISEDKNGLTYGITYLFPAYNSYFNNERLENDSKKNSTYNVSDGERIIAYSADWTVEWLDKNSPDSKQNLSFYFNDTESQGKRVKFLHFYMADPGAQVSWNAQTNTFDSSDASFKELPVADYLKQGRGNSTPYTVQGATKKKLYFVLKAGDEENLAQDIAAGRQSVYIYQTYGDRRLVTADWSGLGITFIVAKNDKVALMQDAEKSLVAPTDVVKFRLIGNTYQSEVPKYAILDVLPFEGDQRGTKLAGSYRLDGDRFNLLASAQEGQPQTKWQIFYTTDPKVRTAGKEGALPNSEDLDRTNPTASLGVTWKAAVADGSDFKLQDSDKGVTPTAFMVYGDFKGAKNKSERVAVKFGLVPTASATSDSYVNDATASGDYLGLNRLATSLAQVAINAKWVSGRVFVDKNRNGQQDEGEPALSGVTVSLLDKLDQPLAKDVHGRDYGTITTDANGDYHFDQVPDADQYKVKVSLSDQQKADYHVEGYVVNGQVDQAVFAGAQGAVGKPVVEPASSTLFDMKSYGDLAADNQLLATSLVNAAVVPIEKADIKIAKVWQDANGQVLSQTPTKEIKVDVLRDNQVLTTLTLNAANNWRASLDGQLVTNEATGQAYSYGVQEQGLDAKGDAQYGGVWYRSSVSGNLADGFTITNKALASWSMLEPAKTQLAVKKNWQGQDQSSAPGVSVELYQDGQATGKTKELNAANGWSGTFDGLEYAGLTANGPHVYSVKEVGEVDGRVTLGDKTFTVAYEGGQITNTLVNPKVALTGRVEWVDHDNQDGVRPDQVLVTLTRNGQATEVTTLSTKADWLFAFRDLDKYDASGNEIVYGIAATPVEQYSVSVEGTVITYVHDPAKTTVQVNKVWVDDNDAVQLRPGSIHVRLLADGVEVAQADVSAAGNWTYSFDNLDQYSAGKLVHYTVTEDGVANYESQVTETEKGRWTLTNSLVGKTTVQVNKVWVDDNDAVQLRPASVHVRLLSDGVEVAQADVSAAGNWTYSFDNLDQYSAGKLVHYTVTEDGVANYESQVTETEKGRWTLTNSLTGQVNITVRKVWKGAEAESVTLVLKADGQEIDRLALTAAMNWVGSFKNLPAYDKQGRQIAYSLEEVALEGYTSEISGNAQEGFVITNTAIPVVTTTQPGPDPDPQPTPTPNPKPEQPELPNTGVPEERHNRRLPNTGSQNPTVLVAVGLLVLVAGCGLLLVSKNKHRKD